MVFRILSAIRIFQTFAPLEKRPPEFLAGAGVEFGPELIPPRLGDGEAHGSEYAVRAVEFRLAAAIREMPIVQIGGPIEFPPPRVDAQNPLPPCGWADVAMGMVVHLYDCQVFGFDGLAVYSGSSRMD